MPKIPSRPALDLIGKWAVVGLPTLPESTSPDRTGFKGRNRDGLASHLPDMMSGGAGNASKHHSPLAGYNGGDKDIIIGTLRYRHGDDLPFVWKRLPQATPACRKTGRSEGRARGG